MTGRKAVGCLSGRALACRRAATAKQCRLTANGCIPIRRTWMIAQPLWSSTTGAPRDGLKHVRHVARIVACPRHNLRAKQVGLALVCTAVLQKIGLDPTLRSLRHDGPGTATDHRSDDLPGKCAELELLSIGRLSGAVAQHDVTEFVCDDTGDLAISSRGVEHAAVHEN